MNLILIIFSCLIFVSNTNGARFDLSISIDEDALELTKLVTKFWSTKPALLQRIESILLCEIMVKCCSVQDQSLAMPLMIFLFSGQYSGEDPLTQVLKKCNTFTIRQNTIGMCPSIYKLIHSLIATDQEKSDLKKYRNVITKYGLEFTDLTNRVAQTCNNEEIHDLLCPSNNELLKTCVDRILQEIYDNDGNKIYQEFKRKAKQTMIDINQELFELFINNSTTI